MAYIVPNIRKVNAKLGQKEVNFYGKRWAIQDNLDGYSVVNVSVEQAPSEIKQYLEGNSSITIYPIASNVVKICDYALASFPNIETIYLFKKDSIVEFENNAFATLNNLTSIYVPNDLIDTYKSTYSDLESKFVGVPSDYEWEVPYLGTDLTLENFDELVNMLSVGQKGAISKIVFPTSYTLENVKSIAWGYNFTSKFQELNNNIYYGTQKLDFTEIVISGSGALTSEIVDSAISGVSSDKLNGVKKLTIDSNFETLISLDSYIANQFVNLDTIEYGNPNIAGQRLITLSNSAQITSVIYHGQPVSSQNLLPSQITNALFTYSSTKGYRAGFISSNKSLISVNYIGLTGTYGIGWGELGRDANAGRPSWYFPKLARMCYSESSNGDLANIYIGKAFFGQKTFDIGTGVFISGDIRTNAYFDATIMPYALTLTQINFSNKIGIIDGNNIYTDKGFAYPKLSSTLYIDANGHLIENEVDLFADYNATWFTDEECTMEIAPNDIASDMTVYVKLVAIS